MPCRIFNPMLQPQKYDADGVFIRKYVPELRGLKIARTVHDPFGTLDPAAFAALG
jgi:deoxyribodipyrimidine photo-lyase